MVPDSSLKITEGILVIKAKLLNMETSDFAAQLVC